MKELPANKELINENFFEYKEIKVDPGQSPLRVDKFLLERLEKVSRNRIQNALRAGAIKIDNQEVKPNYKVRPNQLVQILLPKAGLGTVGVSPEDIPVDVRYEDEHLLVLHKEPGMVVHPGKGNYSGTLVNALMHYLEKQNLPVMKGNSLDRPGLVHRIDKYTSGLMVIAKTEFAMSHLAKQFFERKIDREYVALVWGQPKEDAGLIEGHIGRHPKNRLQMTVFPDGDFGKHAITHYEVIEPMYYISLVKCRLETGRTHQIRVHMKYLGHPIFNDERYGGNRILKGTIYSKYKQFVDNCFKILPRQALHAKTLGFIHPATSEKMFFDSDIPEDMSKAMDKWRNYLNTRKNIS
jgi:23S rRNA pseudouridine1911/1915/1917 synthase